MLSSNLNHGELQFFYATNNGIKENCKSNFKSIKDFFEYPISILSGHQGVIAI